MKTSVLIIREACNTWVLQITCNIGMPQEFVTKRVFAKLIEALDAACALQMHVDNNEELPLKQYRRVS